MVRLELECRKAVESVHFPLWNYNLATGKLKLDSAAYATLGYVGLRPRSRTSSIRSRSRRTRSRRNLYPPSDSELCAAKRPQGYENRFKQLVKKVGPEKAEAMLQTAEQGFKENYALLKKLSEM